MKRALCLSVLLITGTVWAQPAPTPAGGATRIEPQGVAGDTTRFPPQPKGYREATDPTKTLRVVAAADQLTTARVAALRQRAEADGRVQAALGARFAFLSAAFVDSGVKTQPPPRQDVELNYFNYATNRAVAVRFAGDVIKAVDVLPAGFQPPESDGEVLAAAEIVRKDPRYATTVGELPARGILTPAPEGHRYVYVLFKKPKEPAVFEAVVDLTDRKVVRATPIVRE